MPPTSISSSTSAAVVPNVIISPVNRMFDYVAVPSVQLLSASPNNVPYYSSDTLWDSKHIYNVPIMEFLEDPLWSCIYSIYYYVQSDPVNDQASDKIFYVNEKTGQTTWDLPANSSADLCVEAPTFIVILPQPSDEVYFSVHQQDIRVVNALPYVDFGVTVMRLISDNDEKKYELVAASGNSADRQNQTVGMSLPAGQV